MLEVKISKALHSFHLSSSFTVQNEILGILGASGSGKSMTLQCIAGLQTPSSGKIVLNDRTLFDSDKKINIRPQLRKIGYVFQNYALFPHLTVEKNIAFGLNHLPKRKQQQSVLEMMDRMRIMGLQHRYPDELSGGQQQRVALARTFVTQPDILLLDEPFSALDRHVKSQLEQELLDMIHDHFKGSILFITHNLEEAYKLCDRILMYDNGNTVQLGRKEDIMNQPANLTVAKMTGCENLIPVYIHKPLNGKRPLSTGEWTFFANDHKLNYDGKMIAGIRSHHLKIHAKATEDENIFPCQINKVIETISSMIVYVLCIGHLFTVNITKEDWRRVTTSNQPIYLQLPAKHIFLVSDEE
ncbi:sulfate/molybdate ABC transporter ATP-binding protein [Bacillus sp. V3B]|uniref:sulfate/molybdate ABC transporter ATP-binding protein n=1 Tax=Bacillus sp. V3B TaxID=2804915 RepID=UPI00210E2A7C|nr:sulfate/molybdate ABC transporter ATP-binding protein [Bacillus sp. V3B]MCQ6276484.1 sulfate/molybdate ABC transporter ATP-binding protein [Bacillus sp. V3B]